MLRLTEEELGELRVWMRSAKAPHVRMKAAALWNLGRGKTRGEVADFLGVSLASVTSWSQRYRAEGIRGFAIRPGRGRKKRADDSEVDRYLRQSPRSFDIPQTRWTLKSLAQAAPSLKGFTESGVRKVLNRMGYRYKRGQPYLHSPDPAYEEKKGPWTRR